MNRMDFVRVISKALVVVLMLIGIILFISGINNFYAFEFIIGSVVAIFFFYLIDWMKISPNYKIFVVLAICLHVFGSLLVFHSFFYYDKFLHFLFAILITLVVSDWYRKNMRLNNSLFPIFIFMTSLGIFGMWEIYEYIGDILFSLHSQGVFNSAGIMILSRIDDTMQDMITSSIGSIVTLLYINIKKVRKEKLSKNK